MKVSLIYHVNFEHDLIGITVEVVDHDYAVTILGRVKRSLAIELAYKYWRYNGVIQ